MNSRTGLSRRKFLKKTAGVAVGAAGLGYVVPSLALSTGYRKSPGNSSKRDEQLPLGAVVILLDTVRADHVSCYGYDKLTTPTIDILANKGVRFEQVVSPAPWTLPSVASLLSGQLTERTFNSQKKIKSSIAEVFQKAGFATAAITEGAYVSKYFHMDRGFKYYYEEEGPIRLRIKGKLVSDSDGTGNINTTFKKAKKWLKKHKNKPFFLFIHTYEPHMPYTNHHFTQGMNRGRFGGAFEISYLDSLMNGSLTLTEEEKQYIHALYEGDIYSADSYLGTFLEFLKEVGLEDKTVVAVTSDHGEELGEHHERYSYDHGSSLKDNQLMVPLVIYDPTRQFTVKQVHAQVRLFDVLPTITELLGVEINYPTAGRSLVEYMTNKETPGRLAVSGHTRRGPSRYSIRDGRYKYIEVGTPDKDIPPMQIPKYQLYDLLKDPEEKINLADTSPELVKTYSAALQQHVKKLINTLIDDHPEVLNEQLRQRLRSLGYIE